AAALGVVEIANAPAIRIAANNKSFFFIFRIPPKSMISNLTEERRHATNLTIGTTILARIRCSISHGIMRLCLCSGYLMRRLGKVRQTQVETALWICLSGRPKSIQSRTRSFARGLRIKRLLCEFAASTGGCCDAPVSIQRDRELPVQQRALL